MLRSFATVALLALSTGCATPSEHLPDGTDPGAGRWDGGRDEDLAPNLEPLRQAGSLPALAAATFDESGTLGLGATGVRKSGDATPVTGADKWHLGSCTKAMTATLTALIVEEGKLGWSTTLQQAFGADWVQNLDPGYAQVTVLDLLGHRGGTPANVPNDLWDPLWKPGDVEAQRKTFVQGLLSRPPAQTPGTFVYSNAGYMVVGALLEKLTGASWEQLMTERIFEPLEMRSCGFGPQASPNAADQPWGHRYERGSFTPVHLDNPPALGPAGTVHCSLEDWGGFLREHLNGLRGRPTRLVLPAATWSLLHTPLGGGDYALGWIVATRSWSPGEVYSHAGSNTMNFAVVWLAPEIDRIFVAATNAPEGRSALIADQAIGRMLQRYR